MTMHHPELDRGYKGAKRSSWSKLHYRDLALKVCEDNPDTDVETLAQLFLVELKKFPEYLESISVYVMANVRASLTPHVRKDGTPLDSTVIERVVSRAAALVLMSLPMPSGKTLGQSTGAECTKAGGWLVKVGRKVGARGVVGERLTENDLQKMLKG